MPQYLKDEIEESIALAALEVFAARGYGATTMAEIAEVAGISTGNIYRYFPGKRQLWHAVLPDEFAKKLASLVRRRVEALHGVADIQSLGGDAPYRAISEELLRFTIDNRLRVVLLLGRAEGTEYAGFAEKIVQDLVKLAISYAKSTQSNFELPANARFVLEQIYRNFVTMLVSILMKFKEPSQIQNAIEKFSQYHLTGLQAFLTPTASV